MIAYTSSMYIMYSQQKTLNSCAYSFEGSQN